MSENGAGNVQLWAQRSKTLKLGRVLRALLVEEPAKTQAALEYRGIRDLQAFLRAEDEEQAALDLENAIWDEGDGVYRCPRCSWEVEGEVCSQGCGLQFDIPVNIQDTAEYTNEALNPDRVSQARGSTPLRDEEPYNVPSGYSYDEYNELRRRGATRLMCQTFNLEFDSDTGIVAWADSEMYEEFAGPLMQKGDFWKIMLGRRITLDEDDLDGSAFIEALLEDALLFQNASVCEWHTIEETPGIWVTRVIDSDDESCTSTADSTGTETSGHVSPAFPVQARHYETSDAESDNDAMPVDEADGDDGWAWEANVPDRTWGGSEDEEELEEQTNNQEGEIKVEEAERSMVQCSDDDSADSDFDDDEVLSGDEPTLRAGRAWLGLPQN